MASGALSTLRQSDGNCASVIPWGLLFLPETLTLITGVAILPVLHLFTEVARREREALPVLPVARRVHG